MTTRELRRMMDVVEDDMWGEDVIVIPRKEIYGNKTNYQKMQLDAFEKAYDIGCIEKDNWDFTFHDVCLKLADLMEDYKRVVMHGSTFSYYRKIICNGRYYGYKKEDK